MGKKWIQDVVEPHERGALHRQLGIPVNVRIPKTLLKAIHGTGKNAKKRQVGKVITNPTKIGPKKIKITSLLWQRTHFALNVGYGRYRRKRR